MIALIQVFWRYVLDNSLSWPDEIAIGVHLDYLSRHRHGDASLPPVRDRSACPARLDRRGPRIHTFAVRGDLPAVAALLLIYGGELVPRRPKVARAAVASRSLYLAIPMGAAICAVFLRLEPIEVWRRRSGLCGVSRVRCVVPSHAKRAPASDDRRDGRGLAACDHCDRPDAAGRADRRLVDLWNVRRLPAAGRVRSPAAAANHDQTFEYPLLRRSHSSFLQRD